MAMNRALVQEVKLLLFVLGVLGVGFSGPVYAAQSENYEIQGDIISPTGGDASEICETLLGFVGEDGEYQGFVIHVSEPTKKPLEVDWWIVESK